MYIWAWLGRVNGLKVCKNHVKVCMNGQVKDWA